MRPLREDRTRPPPPGEADVYRSLLERSSFAVFSVDSEGHFEELNAACAALIGAPSHELVGRLFTEFVAPDDLARARVEFERILSGDSMSDEYGLVRVDGSRRRLRIMAVPVRVAGETVRVVGIAEDVTSARAEEIELREREAGLAVIAQLGLDALRGNDLQRLMERAVERVAEILRTDYAVILQLEPGGAEFRVRAAWGIDPEARAMRVPAGSRSQAGYTIEMGEPVVTDDLEKDPRFERPAAAIIEGSRSGVSVVIEGQGRAFGVLGTHSRRHRSFHPHDVAFLQGVANILANAIERRAMEEGLERRIQERTASLQQALNDLETFTNSVSHDLRAPLRGGHELLHVLKEDFAHALPQDAQDLVERIVNENARATRLVHEILAFSRSGHQEIARAVVDVTEVARELTRSIDADHPDWRTTWSIEDGIAVVADPALFRIALRNVLDNAAKYSSRQEEPRVCVESATLDNMRGVRVRDNGIGFVPGEAHKLFGTFTRLPSALSYPGTGLGLATVHRIVTRHGGRVLAESRAGQGATFTLAFGSANAAS